MEADAKVAMDPARLQEEAEHVRRGRLASASLLAAFAAELLRLREREQELEAVGQALRDTPYTWDSSREAADAADAWDELVAR